RAPSWVIIFADRPRVPADPRPPAPSPYRHLLKPKVGGLSVALATMGEQFEALLDLTLVYPGGTPSFWDLLCGRLPAVVLRVQRRDIPENLLGMDASGERARLVRQARWLEQLWQEKDAWIEATLKP
ncbi:MAG: acyltransferase, partial [Inhella sp.]